MRKRLLALLLCVVTVLGLFAAPASAASSEEEALGEIDIYSGGTKMSYLSINGRNRELVYTYYNYVDSTGQTKQIPAYCVNPDIEGVPQTVAPGESIKYMADEIGTDPKAVGIVAHGYPTRSLEELHLENAEQAYYATKMALWCYLLSNWDINDLKVNPSLSGVELQRAQKILAAAKDIYVRGTRWNEVPQPRVTCLPDRDTAYEVTVDGKTYKQQIFTFWSETWICNYRVDVAFALPDEVPEGTRIVDLSNRDITFITTEDTGSGYAGQFKLLYPADQVEGKTGSVRLSFRTDVYKYGIFYATCMETDEYGQLQDYLVDTDPTTEMRLSAYSNYEDGGTVTDNRTKLKILKLETETDLPLSGALFEVVDPEGATVGVFSTDDDGEIELPLTLEGNYTVIERAAPPDHLPSEEPAQNVKVEYGETATLTFYNAPYGNLEVRKASDTGDPLPGVLIQIKHIESGVTYTQETDPSGAAFFSELQPGGYEVRELTGIPGWQADTDTVTGLETGTYIVEELASDSGHVIDTAPQTAYLSGKEQDVVQLYFGNSPKGALLVKKVDASNGKPISDVEFLVTTSAGTVVGDANGRYVTDSAGTFLVEGIAPGTTLMVKETRAKDGYLLDDTPQTAMIKAGQTVTLEFRNQPNGNLIINKLDSVTRKPLEGVEFQLTYADGSYVDAEGGTLSSKGLYYTDENGQIILSGLTGTIVATETKTIEGYTIHEETRSQTVVINPNDTQTLVFYNDPVGGVEIIKVNASDKDERIPGTTFEIRKVDDELVDTVTTDKNGRVFVALEDGAYYAVEIEAPEGYKLDDTPHYFEVVNGKTEPLKITNQAVSGILIHKTDSTTGEGIYGVTFLLYDSSNTPIGQYTSDDRGYVCIEDPEAGRYYLRELENEGYVPDTQKKTVYVKSGKTTEVEWENTPITGQIQITKTSADYNSMNGWPAGTPIPNTVFEIYNYRTGKLVDTVRTDKNGVAVSKPLPLGRYKVVEAQAAEFYGLDKTPIEVELEFAGQIVKTAMTNRSLYTNVSIKKTGYAEVMPGQSIQYDLSGIANNSTTSLTSFFWRDILPTQAVRLDKIITGTYNVPGNYKVVYQTNLSNGAWRTMYDNLSTMQNHTLDASPAALGLASNEYVTAFMVSFGVVPANFRQVEAPRIYCSVLPQLTGGTQFVNQADVGGIVETSSVSLAPPLAPELAYSAASPLPNQTGSSGLGSQYGQWSMATSRWVTRVYKPSEPLPRTGY